jgi:hypothetical protein
MVPAVATVAVEKQFLVGAGVSIYAALALNQSMGCLMLHVLEVAPSLDAKFI